MVRKVLVSAAAALVVLFLALQLVPLGRVDHPPVVREPAWVDARTEQLARRACYDCHSNETRVPWYGRIAPVSWLVAHHVDEARATLNFSEMHRSWEEAHEAGEVVREGEMPPRYYTLLHPSARLTAEERDALARGLDATLGGEEEHEDRARDGGERHRRGRGDDDHDDD